MFDVFVEVVLLRRSDGIGFVIIVIRGVFVFISLILFGCDVVIDFECVYLCFNVIMDFLFDGFLFGYVLLYIVDFVLFL